MANIKSAKKRIRQARVHTFRNRVRRSIARTAVRRFMEALQAGDHEKAFLRLKYASGRLDRAAQKGAMHRNNAARKKSQIWRRYNQSQKSAASS